MRGWWGCSGDPERVVQATSAARRPGFDCGYLPLRSEPVWKNAGNKQLNGAHFSKAKAQLEYTLSLLLPVFLYSV